MPQTNWSSVRRQKRLIVAVGIVWCLILSISLAWNWNQAKSTAEQQQRVLLAHAVIGLIGCGLFWLAGLRSSSGTALSAHEYIHRNVLAATMDGFLILDRAGRFLDANQAYCDMSGYGKDELLAMSVYDIDTDFSAAEVVRELEKISSRGEDRFESRHRRKDGSLIEVEVSVQYVDGGTGIFFAFIRDITEQKQVKRNLQESEERFKALHNASFGGITIHDKGLILECNQGLADITGYSVEELIGMDGLLLIAPESRERVMEKISSGYEKPYEALGERKNGEIYPIRLQASNVPYKGRLVRTVEFRDITEQKEHEAEREQLQQQLLQAQKMESVGRLAGGVAHDFNNMLSVIIGQTELIQETVSDVSPISGNLKEIHSAAERSADLTRRLLAFARKQTIAPKLLDLNEAVSGTLKMIRRLIGEDIELIWLPGPRPLQVMIDPSQLDQLLANLCVNARDAITEAGKMTIETENAIFDSSYCAIHPDYVPGDYAALMISDNGCGMSRETLQHIFEPFYTTKEMGKGTGLGLAMVYGIVRQNSGFINVYSEPGKGTTFKIYLPRQKGGIEPVSRHDSSPRETTGNETILLVEDESSILSMIQAMLERLGYTVLPVHTPGEALALAAGESVPIDLLLTDVVMPEMNGRQLASRLTSRYPHLKTLYMSGYTANVIAHHGVLDPDVAFLEKPFSLTNLAATVRSILDRR